MNAAKDSKLRRLWRDILNRFMKKKRSVAICVTMLHTECIIWRNIKSPLTKKRGTGFAKHVRIPVIESVILSFICEFTLERNRFNATNVLLNFPTKAACEHIQITVHHNHFNFNTHLKIHLNNCMLSFYFAVKKNKIKDIKKCFLNYTFSHLIHI